MKTDAPNLIEVEQSRPSGYLRIEYNVGDVCNFQCWYCRPEATAAVYKWPNLEVVKKNLSHLLDYYIKHTDKRTFEINILGGEVIHWKQFPEFLKYFKEKYNVIFAITSNGSKSLDWWKEIVQYIDHLYVSHHQLFSKKEHNRELLDYFYEQKVIASTGVLMDPTCWDDCLDTVEYFKKSKHSWSIRYAEILHFRVNYTEDQKRIISKVFARRSNFFHSWRYNRISKMHPKLVFENGKTKKVSDNYIVLNRLNKFRGWDCSVGVDFLSIRFDGALKGTCGNFLYNEQHAYNIYDSKFTEHFSPTILHTTCDQDSCWCSVDVNMPKKKLNLTNKVIPIYAH
jgi:organic radical activating enzyme